MKNAMVTKGMLVMMIVINHAHGGVPPENGIKIQNHVETRRPMAMAMNVVETCLPHCRTKESIMQDMKESYALSTDIQEAYASVEEFIDDAMPEISELELSAADAAETERYHIIISPIGRYGRYYTSDSAGDRSDLNYEIYQIMDQSASWDTWTVDHKKQVIMYSKEKKVRYREYERIGEIESVVVLNWLSAKRTYEQENPDDTWIGSLCRTGQQIDPDGCRWKLVVDETSNNAIMEFSFPDEEDGAYEYEYDLSGDAARLIRREFRTPAQTETWVYRYEKNGMHIPDGYPHYIAYKCHYHSQTDGHLGHIERAISIQRVFSPSQWDVKQTLNKAIAAHTAYSILEQ